MSGDEITMCSLQRKKQKQLKRNLYKKNLKVHWVYVNDYLLLYFWNRGRKNHVKFQSFCHCWRCFSSETVAHKRVKRLSICVYICVIYQNIRDSPVTNLGPTDVWLLFKFTVFFISFLYIFYHFSGFSFSFH